MCGKNGNLLRHFTPYQTPLSAGVNMFCQIIDSKENCFLYPPFSIALPAIKFIIENKLTCSAVIPADYVTPAWMPSLSDRIQDAFLIGHKGDKGVINVVSKKGFVDDKFGLQNNLWVIRIDGNRHDSKFMPYGKRLLFYRPMVLHDCHFVGVGDSMIRFLLKEKSFFNPMVHVISQGGDWYESYMISWCS